MSRELDAEALMAIVDEFARAGLRELRLVHGGYALELGATPATPATDTRATPHATTTTTAATPASVGDRTEARAAIPRELLVVVPAPVLGVLRPTGDGPRAGTAIAAGDVLAQLDVLGRAIDVVAPQPGTLVGFLAADGELVEYGQPLVELVPAPGTGAGGPA